MSCRCMDNNVKTALTVMEYPQADDIDRYKRLRAEVRDAA